MPLDSKLQTSTLVFFVNGKKVIEPNPDPESTLLEYLRKKLFLTGTKLGCSEGGCGSCTVMISQFNGKEKKINHYAINACLAPLCSMHGLAVTTIEGIGSTRTKLHPVQERIAKAHGSQCGFCTPGIVMSMYTLLRNTPNPDMSELLKNFQGNLCRCTGYRPIIEGYRTFTKDYQFECGMGEKCCKNNLIMQNGISDAAHDLFQAKNFVPYDSTQEPIFPPELQLEDCYGKETLLFKNARGVTWFRPTSFQELLKFKTKHPDTKIVVGNTEVGVEIKFKKMDYLNFATSSLIPELNEIEFLENGIKIGSAVTLGKLEEVLLEQIAKLSEHETRIYKTIVEMLFYFGGKQIRNVASVGGNIMTASPISDLNPIFLATGVELEISSFENGTRKIKMTSDFFQGYRKTSLQPSEVLKSILIPKSLNNQFMVALKQSKRIEDDISTVVAAFNVFFQENSDVVEEIYMTFGGISSQTVMASETQKTIIGKKWNSDLAELATKSLLDEFLIPPNAPGGMAAYRHSLIPSLFFKAFLKISEEKNLEIPDRYKSGGESIEKKILSSQQTFESYGSRGETVEHIRKPIVHVSALKQATGEAMFCDDIPRMENEVCLAPVLSTKAHAKIISIDESEALKVPGVITFYSGKDIPDEKNMFGQVVEDEYFIQKDIVTAQGQLLGIVVADDEKTAKRAANLVKVVYEELPVIITIEEALAQNSFFKKYPKVFEHGDVETAFKNSKMVVEGESRLGGQEHFYMEPQSTLAYPRDVDEIELFCSTQGLSNVQRLVSKVLGLPANKISCKTKRIGGGFGGKEVRAFISALPAAFTAYKLKRPARIQLDRNEDMMATGNRHPFYFKYKVAINETGLIQGAVFEVYSNGGCTLDVSMGVIENAIMNVSNAYHIPNIKITYGVLKTNLPSNTAFRGFGTPQSFFNAEGMIRDIADAVGKPYAEIQELNMYKTGDKAFFNMTIENNNVNKCFKEVIKRSEFERRRQEVQEFNTKNRWKKQGISITNCMNGMALLPEFMGQGGALVNVYSDGSVGLFHGGIEMGQGLHTKCIQVAATALNIPVERIYTIESSSDRIPNAIPTCASVGSDVYGMAVLKACNTILERLKPMRDMYPKNDWNFWVEQAFFKRIQLSATGFHMIPDIIYDIKKNEGTPFAYFTNGSAVSHVEIDCLTGAHQVLRTDIVMDVGASLNPAIDIGQIEGAFMQGYGLYCMEELVYSPEGTLYSKGPGAYKIPGFSDIPGVFNVALLAGSENPKVLYSSKGVGEPPLTLATSVFYAIKEAIAAARLEEGCTGKFKLESPATAERIRLACQDKFTVKQQSEIKCRPWNVQP